MQFHMSVAPYPIVDVSEFFVPERSISRDKEKRVNLFILCGLALAVGVMTGCGAVALRALIGFFHNAFFSGILSFRV